MAGMSTYLLDAALDHMVGNTALTAITNVYAKVHIGDPGADGTGNPSEHTTRYAATFGAAAGKVASNNAQIDINSVALTGNENWSGLSLWDTIGPAGGNCLYVGTFAPVLMQNGDSFAFAIGDIDVSLGGAWTAFAANEMLDHTLGVGAYAQPAGVFAKFHIGDPTDAGTANPATDTRRANAGAFSAAAAGATANTGVVTLSSITDADTWSHTSLWDTVGPAGGNPLFYGALTASKNVQVGDDAEFAVGELDIVLT